MSLSARFVVVACVATSLPAWASAQISDRGEGLIPGRSLTVKFTKMLAF